MDKEIILPETIFEIKIVNQLEYGNKSLNLTLKGQFFYFLIIV